MHAILVTLAALQAAPGTVPDSVPLYDDLGSHHYEITTSEPLVQEYFDQGLRLYCAFNHQEAIRSFRAAQALDPECAMCWWGEALAWGPNINLPMDSVSGVAAYAAAQQALESSEASERERAFVEALARRYAPDLPADRAALDSAYTRAMEDVSRRWPHDPEAAVLYAEAEMTLRPWDYWTEDEEPYPGIRAALAKLEGVMDRNSDHPGACHFYIHAVEKVDPDRAVPCAERLADLMPGAGHLVHMPGHIYIRVGRYLDAIRANEHAVHADETYIRDQRPGMGVYTAGYYPHNYDFMTFAATMAGRSGQAVEAARKMTEVVPEEMHRAPGMTFVQHFLTRPLQVYVRFGLWEEILRTAEPAEDLHHARGMWHYARGRALVATGDLDRAVEELREAARLEDAMLYGEPPEWTVPVRHELGEVLLAAGRAEEAERIYREDLERFRENGWSLMGLARALEAQGRSDESDEVATRFRAAWAEADLEIASSSF